MHQSGFKPVDSCINKLLSITFGVYQSLDDGLGTRSSLLHICKPFDKLWLKNLILLVKAKWNLK